jgi:hypothetical protein
VNVIDKQVCQLIDRLLMVDASRDASFHRKRRSPIGEVRAGNGYENSGRPGPQGE